MTDTPQHSSTQEQEFAAALDHIARVKSYLRRISEAMVDAARFDDLPLEAQQVYPGTTLKAYVALYLSGQLERMTSNADHVRGDLIHLVLDTIDTVVPSSVQEMLFDENDRASTVDRIVDRMLRVPYDKAETAERSRYLWREKTKIVQARQFIGGQREDVAEWCGGTVTRFGEHGEHYVLTLDLNGIVSVREGDWIVQDHRGFSVYANVSFVEDYVPFASRSQHGPHFDGRIVG